MCPVSFPSPSSLCAMTLFYTHPTQISCFESRIFDDFTINSISDKCFALDIEIILQGTTGVVMRFLPDPVWMLCPGCTFVGGQQPGDDVYQVNHVDFLDLVVDTIEQPFAACAGTY